MRDRYNAEELAAAAVLDYVRAGGDVPEAERWCAKYAAVPGFEGRAKAFRAHVLEENGQLQDARKLLLDAMKEHPQEPDLFIAYGDMAMKHHVPGHAIDAYRAAVRLLQRQGDEIERLRDIERRLAEAIVASEHN